MKLHIFNPEHDTVMAYGKGMFTSPHAARELRRDLGFIASLWAEDGDFVLVDDIEAALESVRHVKKYVADVVFITYADLKNLNLEDIPDFSIEPWGWDDVLKRQLTHAAPALQKYLPDDATIECTRIMSNRRFAAENMLPWLRDADDIFVGRSRYVTSMEEMNDELMRNGRSVLKSPWSSSGRGVKYVDGIAESPVSGWCRNVISRQGGIMVEPYYNKVIDFGMEFCIDDSGHSEYCGLSLFRTVNGAYAGNILATEKEKRKMIGRYVSVETMDRLAVLVSERMDSVSGGRYKGPFGVDMMVVADDSGKGFKVHPCVELNLRRTMGHVALCVSPDEYEAQKLMRIFYSGKYRLRIFSTNENLLNTSLAV